jgi:hypothetical protein
MQKSVLFLLPEIKYVQTNDLSRSIDARTLQMPSACEYSHRHGKLFRKCKLFAIRGLRSSW